MKFYLSVTRELISYVIKNFKTRVLFLNYRSKYLQVETKENGTKQF